jgi:hypothetical protein
MGTCWSRSENTASSDCRGENRGVRGLSSGGKSRSCPRMMSFGQLEQRFGWLSFPGFLRFYALLHALVYLLQLVRPDIGALLEFDRAKILSGQVWRVVTFLFSSSGFAGIGMIGVLFFYFMVMIAFMMSDALEGAWGVFKTSLFYYFGILALIVANFVFPYGLAPVPPPSKHPPTMTHDPDQHASLGAMYSDYFLDYASYVILERAVPHLNDGLKPVQRRILHAMDEIDDGRYNKVAGHRRQHDELPPARRPVDRRGHRPARAEGPAHRHPGQLGQHADRRRRGRPALHRGAPHEVRQRGGLQPENHQVAAQLRRPPQGAGHPAGEIPAAAGAGRRRHRRRPRLQGAAAQFQRAHRGLHRRFAQRTVHPAAGFPHRRDHGRLDYRDGLRGGKSASAPAFRWRKKASCASPRSPSAPPPAR